MSTEEVRAYALGYAAERAAATEDAELLRFLRAIGATHYERRNGLVIAYDGRRRRTVWPPRSNYNRWHTEKNWEPFLSIPEGALEV
jgi:hypothetical protein